jgi:hypothetical protein
MPRLPTKKLLVASIGVGALTFAAIGAFPGCNLMAPPPCDEAPTQYHCRDMSTPDLQIADMAVPDMTQDRGDQSGVD